MKNISVYICIILALFTVLSECKKQTKLEFGPAFVNVNAIDIPVDMDSPDEEYIYVTSLNGAVYKFANDDETSTSFTFLDLANSELAFYATGLVGDEGLLSIEFHPDYPTVPKVYVAYTPTLTTLAIVAFTVSSGTVDYNSIDVLFNITRPLAKDVGYITEAYLGGDLRFALENEEDDDDCDNHSCTANLFISIGYGNDDSVTSNPSNLLGKILRVTPHTSSTGYSLPSSNTKISGVTTPIYAKGLRNPRKMYFSEEPSYLFVGDVGDVYDEINVIQKNKNYGWNVVEGCTNNYLYANPIYSYTSEDAPHAITQGPYYDGHGSGFKAIRERVLFADLYSGTLYAIQSDNVGVSCGITPSVVASAPALISSILVVGNDVIVSNVIGSYYGVPSFYRLVEVPV